LLPKDLRRKKRRQIQMPKLPTLPALPAALGVIAVLIAVHVLMLLVVGSNRKEYGVLEEKWNQMKPQRERTERLAREINNLERRIAAVKKIAKPDLDWSMLLSGLNQSIIPNIWLSNFELSFRDEKDKKIVISDLPVWLNLNGYALGKSEEATATVARFINSLKKNMEFSSYFEEIELKNMRNLKISEEEVMMFNLNCRFGPIGFKSDEKIGEDLLKK